MLGRHFRTSEWNFSTDGAGFLQERSPKSAAGILVGQRCRSRRLPQITEEMEPWVEAVLSSPGPDGG